MNVRKRDPRAYLYVFRIHEGLYGDRAYHALLSELISREPGRSAGFRFYWGDYLPYQTIEAVVLTSPSEERGQTEVSSRAESPTAAAMHRMYVDFLDAAPHSTLPAQAVYELPRLRLWGIVIVGQHSPLDVIDGALRGRVDDDYYVGGLEIDAGNPVQRALTLDTLPFWGFYRGGHLALRYDDDMVATIVTPPAEARLGTHEWYESVGAVTYSLGGLFDLHPHPEAALRVFATQPDDDDSGFFAWRDAHQGEDPYTFYDEPGHDLVAKVMMPPPLQQVAPSKRGQRSLSVLLSGLTLFGVEQLLTGLLHIGANNLATALDRWAKIPDFAATEIDLQKLEGYALNPEHVEGKHKARVFRSVLGLTQKDAGYLRSEIERAMEQNPTITGLVLTDHGARWELELRVNGLNGRSGMVKTGWIVNWDVATPRPRLTTLLMKV